MPFRSFIRNFLHRLYDPGRPAWHEKLMAREMSEPSEALDYVVSHGIRPNFETMAALLTELAMVPLPPRVLSRCAASVAAQCLFYHHAGPVLRRLDPEALDNPDLEEFADHIVEYSLGGFAHHAPGAGRMNIVALKMLMGDRAKYLGIIMGITFASLLITQQLAIFIGLMARTYGAITDLGLPDIWVMDSGCSSSTT